MLNRAVFDLVNKRSSLTTCVKVMSRQDRIFKIVEALQAENTMLHFVTFDSIVLTI